MSAISTVFILMISGVIFLYGAVEPEEAEINAENAANDAQNRENAQRKQTEEVKLRSEEPARMAEEAKNAAQKEREKAEEAKRQPQAASERLEEALKAAEGQRIHAEEQLSILASQLEQAQTNLRMGLQPVVWPTEEEFNNAKERVQYRSDRLHFAVCGFSGTGKSSLINAVRGLANQDDGAAPTGVVETTMNTQRYPDIRKEDPFPRFVWFDVPGGGGAKVTDWQYFNDQGLFIFDVILVVYNDRVTKLDISILENCRRFNIPAFIVRSKADNHIRQTMKDLGYTKKRKAEKERFYTKARGKFVNDTRTNLEDALRSAKLPDQRVYIVSSETLCRITAGEQEEMIVDEKDIDEKNIDEKVIDEIDLIQDVLEAAYGRRYGASQETPARHTQIVKQCVTAARQAIENLHFQKSKEAPSIQNQAD